MAATRVRLVAELRNGDRNYLGQVGTSTEFVPMKGMDDREALDAAYLILCQEIEKRTGKPSKREIKEPHRD